MLNGPDAIDLIEIARDALLESVLPEVDGATRYQVLMVANALGIARRELEARRADGDHEERSQLRALYGEMLDEDESVEALNHRLARDIRRGEFAGAVEFGLRRLLRAQVEARLRVSNPRRLEPR